MVIFSVKSFIINVASFNANKILCQKRGLIIIKIPSKIIFLSCLILFFSVSVFSQTPTATPPEDNGYVIKISTTLIQLDVIVTDKKGNQITDLKPEDFEIYENGKKRDISNFSYIFSSNGSAKKATEESAAAPKQPDKYSVPAPPSKLKLE
ncbi:MAG: hypothetical protein ABI891_00165 [Acidobacteriota bacterium]